MMEWWRYLGTQKHQYHGVTLFKTTNVWMVRSQATIYVGSIGDLSEMGVDITVVPPSQAPS